MLTAETSVSVHTLASTHVIIFCSILLFISLIDKAAQYAVRKDGMNIKLSFLLDEGDSRKDSEFKATCYICFVAVLFNEQYRFDATKTFFVPFYEAMLV